MRILNVYLDKKENLQAKSGLTKRAVDGGDSAASTSSFLASGFFCSQAFSQPAPPPLTQTVRWLLCKHSQKETSSVPKTKSNQSLCMIGFKWGMCNLFICLFALLFVVSRLVLPVMWLRDCAKFHALMKSMVTSGIVSVSWLSMVFMAQK